jgi:hypothetical protein
MLRLYSSLLLLTLLFARSITSENTKFGGLHDYIFKFSREELIKYAFTAEKYHSEINGQEFLVGGMHDYIGNMSNEEIADYILKEAKEHPEIDSKIKMDLLAKRYGLDQPYHDSDIREGSSSSSTRFGGLHDYIFKFSKDELMKYALTTERYHKEVNGQEGMIGGLHDYIWNMSNDEMIKYILKEAKEHPEIDSKDKLDKLAMKYGMDKPINSNSDSNEIKEEESLKIKRIRSFLAKLNIKKLKEIALAVDKYHYDVTGEKVHEPLEGYIDKMTHELLMDYLMAEIEKHEEIQNLSKILELGMTKEDKKAGDILREKLMTILSKLDRFHQILIARTLDSYYKEKNPGKTGGYENYIDTLTDERLKEYVISEFKFHPEIDSIDTLKELILAYLGK